MTEPRAMQILLAVALIVALAACSEQNRLIGKWVNSRDNSTIEFVSGGTCIITANPPIPTNCSWEMTDDGRIVTHESALSVSVTFIGHFEGDDLVFIGPDGKPMPALHKV